MGKLPIIGVGGVMSVDDVREKLKFDLYYIENMSLNMDFKIFIATVFVVLGRKGAH